MNGVDEGDWYDGFVCEEDCVNGCKANVGDLDNPDTTTLTRDGGNTFLSANEGNAVCGTGVVGLLTPSNPL